MIGRFRCGNVTETETETMFPKGGNGNHLCSSLRNTDLVIAAVRNAKKLPNWGKQLFRLFPNTFPFLRPISTGKNKTKHIL